MPCSFFYFMNRLLGCRQFTCIIFFHHLNVYFYQKYQLLFLFWLCEFSLEVETVYIHIFSGGDLALVTILSTILTYILQQASRLRCISATWRHSVSENCLWPVYVTLVSLVLGPPLQIGTKAVLLHQFV
jgi:hypothetical protein